MNVYLKEMSKWLKSRKAFIAMGNARWHLAEKLTIFSNIKFLFLPPYSPELNPAERFWEHIKENVIKNKVFENLEDLMESVCDFLKLIKYSEIQSICNAGYLERY
jgi:transposase